MLAAAFSHLPLLSNGSIIVAHCFLKALPVTCLFATEPSSDCRDRAVTEMIRIHQNNDLAVAFGLATSQLLQILLTGTTLPQALQTLEESSNSKEVKEALQRAKSAAAKNQGLEDLLLELSHEIVKDSSSGFYDLAARSCSLPAAFLVPMYLLRVHACSGSLTEDTFRTIIRQNILGAGDTCSRGILLGAVLGAAGCPVPSDWMEKMHKETMQQVDQPIEKIIAGQEQK